MVKVHTRIKRKFRMSHVHGRERPPRPKTFKTEDAAKKYAEEKGIKKYTLENLKNSTSKEKKIRIAVE